MPLWDQPAPELAPRARPNAAFLSREDLRGLMSRLGEAPWRGDQVFEGLHKHRFGAWDDFTTLSKPLRVKLAGAADIAWPEIIQSLPSRDGSTKHAFRLADGKEVEGVHMPYASRTTLCLSSQVGCAMGCTFCATGQMGILRNLLPGEITGQVVSMLRRHGAPVGADGEPDPINLVFMGMGEPLHNLDNLMAAFEVLTDAKGLGLSPKRVTVSTSGLVSGIERLGAFAKRPRLAVSLNGTTDEYRSKIMPVNRVWNLDALMDALVRFPLQTNERVTLEYVLLKGVTDSLDDGRRLVALASKFPS
ncbi:MAG TPA: 23S rRNA (adenine(2503)-C(2))-methyltransferase RlmN, partial [Holophagaceae bacterium]|nr:23S rRNA (adenine(2503)-C(2))-methyltransferase RlmN [Holophagaceae bacterium]